MVRIKNQKLRQRASGNDETDPGGGKVASKADTQAWTNEDADKLQDAVDRIFVTAGESLRGLEFSFTIADPFLSDCPLIGCSTGFSKMTGYEVHEVVGRNCRFLVEPVPREQICNETRTITKDFCKAVMLGQEYKVPSTVDTPWMYEGRATDELLAIQKNTRKDGSIFKNLFLLKALDLSRELGDEKPYIVGLQCEMKDGHDGMKDVVTHIGELSEKMTKVVGVLSKFFCLQCSMSRITNRDPKMVILPARKDADDSRKDDTASSSPEGEGGWTEGQAGSNSDSNGSNSDPERQVTPTNLYTAFCPEEVQPWEEKRFTFVRKLCDAPKNKGSVQLMHDQQGDRLVAVKKMPNQWLSDSHEEFLRANEKETEMPWQDIGCTRFLNSVEYKYAVSLLGVYRSDEMTFVTSSYAPGGDLFGVTMAAASPPGPQREAAFAPLILSIFSGFLQLHEMQIVHRDISLENVVLASEDLSPSEIRIIDYGMADTGRMFRNCVRGKLSYQAPEMHTDNDYDAFLSDTFSIGVLLYALLMSDYPWTSTKPGECKNFDFVEKHGFRSYISKRKARGTNLKADQCMSKTMASLLEGMLSVDASKRLTLGEKQWRGRRSVWDEPWTRRRAKHPKGM